MSANRRTALVILSSSLTASAVAGSDEPAKGEIVSDLGNSCRVVFQDADDDYWFGTGYGLFRYDGKVLTRFTIKDGLAHDAIGDIQQHAPTGDLVISTDGGVSKFDGERFVTLPKTELTSPGDSAGPGWSLDPDDLWFRSPTWSKGPCRYDGKTLYALQFPKSPHEEAQSEKYPGPRSGFYDVWSVFRDRKGHLWFGTAMLGACRFDGESWEWIYEQHQVETPEGGWFGLRSVVEDKDGAFWVCNTSYRYRLTKSADAEVDATKSRKLAYTREPAVDPAMLPRGENPIYFQSAVEDAAGDLWLASYGIGVWRWDGRKVKHYPILDGGKVVTLFSIYRDRHDGLWLGSHEHGVYRFDGERFDRFRPK